MHKKKGARQYFADAKMEAEERVRRARAHGSLARIGQHMVLWHYDLVSNAYRDMLGVTHDAHVVKEEITATIVEVEFKDGQDMHGTLIAKTSTGTRIHSRRSDEAGPMDTPFWFPSDMYSEGSDRVDPAKYREYHEVADCYGFRFGGLPFMRPDGLPAIPKDMYICTTHNRAFMPKDTKKCPGCW